MDRRFALGVVVWGIGFLLAGAMGEVGDKNAASGEGAREGVKVYFRAIRGGDEKAGFACWENDVGYADVERKKLIEDVVRAWIRLTVASERLNRAMAEKLPKVFEEAQRVAPGSPTDEEIGKGECVRYLRLAIVRWGPGELQALPMVMDVGKDGREVWKISMQQWYEVNRPSVGDAMLMSGMGVKVTERVTKDVLEGKLKTMEEIQAASLKYFAESAEELGTATQAGEVGGRK